MNVSLATIDACNGMYYGEPAKRLYENNHGGIIYFRNGQWRLTTRTMSADGRLVESMGYAADAFYFLDSDEPEPPPGQWTSVHGTGQCKVEAASIEIPCKYHRSSSLGEFP